MRLNCPNCGAEYEVSDGMIPSDGRHVQCTACHTRWFVRGVPGTGLTEDQILRRLETWSPGLRPVAVPDPARAAPEPAPRAAAPELPPDSPVVVQLKPPRAAPAKPADRPAVAQPGPLAEPAAPAPLAATRPATRLDLGEPAPAAAEPPSRSRFGRGLLLALALCLIALGAYVYRDAIVARVPAAQPALSAYAETVDQLRERLEQHLAPFRPDAGTDTQG